MLLVGVQAAGDAMTTRHPLATDDSASVVKHPSGFPACVHLTVEFNAHAIYYETAEQWIAEQESTADGCWFTWVSPDERARAIATDSVWTCQWYPNTPVGFNALAASSFDVLLMAAVNKV